MGISYVEQLPFGGLVKAQLHDLVQMLIDARIGCEKIVLFGSYARAEQTVSSDFDILVLSPQHISREIKGELCSKFEEKNSDLIFYRSSDFESSDTLLAERIREEGVLLWKN
ncbi:nucleotidyltransferase domain-containing protein [bacterium 1xD8-6]|jgi:Predicted nucleotidyltransferases|nr:nucleotidyltransferase domain-containing protein [bacterium D16-36]RKI65386.1 nucleotidyltransferase domain-containing protein [bacterium 1xD8-6]